MRTIPPETFPRADELPRQFHGGPEVFTPEFSLHENVQAGLDRLAKSAIETQWILEALERSKPYAHFIRSKIEEHRLPPEIFYLPVVESLYKVNAHSRSGALGLWQFMRNSIHPWMVINEWADERKDFWKSTEAAMEKLRQNYNATGSWLLALAAYNCGLTRVQRAVARSGIRDFWELSRLGHLPRETRNYVPQFIAAARYASHLGRQGMNSEWEKPVRWARIQLKQAVDLRLLAEASGVPYEHLKIGNAELVYGITPLSGRPYYLKVREEYAERISEALNKTGGKLLNFSIHTVAAGDTLSEIALHFGITVDMLLKYNPQVRPELLQIGRKLVIPMVKNIGPFVRKAALGEVKIDGPLFFENEYVVKQGDTLWDIARSFGTSASHLARANGISENGIIRPGMTLKVP
jgi:membrane-bound lytic murein transglycosylase D